VKRQAGLTLIELLAALVVSGFVVAMASRIFLSGHAQFVKRSAEAETLAAFYRLKAEVGGALRNEIRSCSGGRLTLRSDSGSFDLGTRLSGRLPALAEARFLCLEPDGDGADLQEWKDADQPALVEYHLEVRTRGRIDSLDGSWLR
jgi:prepilin-type N-terminal cleavage/methylation domain-containing protein